MSATITARDAYAAWLRPQAARLVCAVDDRDETEVQRVLDDIIASRRNPPDVNPIVALAIVLAAMVPDDTPIKTPRPIWTDR